MSEQKSNNDSAPGTFSFFETFQSSGDAIPSLDSISLSGELPQLPTSPPPVTEQPVTEQPVTEQPVTNEPEPVGVGEQDSSYDLARPHERVQKTLQSRHNTVFRYYYHCLCLN